jgi:hypothetical protein
MLLVDDIDLMVPRKMPPRRSQRHYFSFVHFEHKTLVVIGNKEFEILGA